MICIVVYILVRKLFFKDLFASINLPVKKIEKYMMLMEYNSTCIILYT